MRPMRIGGCVTVADKGNEGVWTLIIINQAAVKIDEEGLKKEVRTSS